MSTAVEHESTPSATPPDLAGAVLEVLGKSPEPLTVSKIRSGLPSTLKQVSLEELGQALLRQAAANTIYSFPKYRSPQDRYWDRPMSVHVTNLIMQALEEGPLPATEIKKRLPSYAQGQALEELEELVRTGQVHRHPRRPGTRVGEPYGLRAAEPKDYLRSELSELFGRLGQLGFSEPQIRAAALEILHDEEWAPELPKAPVTHAATPATNEPSQGQQENPPTPE